MPTALPHLPGSRLETCQINEHVLPPQLSHRDSSLLPEELFRAVRMTVWLLIRKHLLEPSAQLHIIFSQLILGTWQYFSFLLVHCISAVCINYNRSTTSSNAYPDFWRAIYTLCEGSLADSNNDKWQLHTLVITYTSINWKWRMFYDIEYMLKGSGLCRVHTKAIPLLYVT